jgi:hypothetical protein
MTEQRAHTVQFPQQPYILTHALQQFFVATHLLADPPYTNATIGIAIGEAGIGKSAAIRYAQEQRAQQNASSHLAIVRSFPRMTESSFIMGLCDAIDETSPPRKHLKTAEVAEHLTHHNVRLILVDEADRLNKAHLALLVSLVDIAQCSFFLVGLPSLHQQCLKFPQVWSRTSLWLQLSPPSFDEILYIVLPELIAPGWIFHPEQKDAQRIAKRLWACASPSLHRLRALVNIASLIAQWRDQPRVTGACIDEAIAWSAVHAIPPASALTPQASTKQVEKRSLEMNASPCPQD